MHDNSSGTNVLMSIIEEIYVKYSMHPSLQFNSRPKQSSFIAMRDHAAR